MRDLSGNFVGEKSSEKEIIVNLCQEFYRLGWMTGWRIQILTRSHKSDNNMGYETVGNQHYDTTLMFVTRQLRIKTLPFCLVRGVKCKLQLMNFMILCSGTGGAIAMRTGDSGILVTPSGVLKESVKEEDIFSLDDAGQVREGPDNSQLKFSSCFPNFQHIYRLR